MFSSFALEKSKKIIPQFFRLFLCKFIIEIGLILKMFLKYVLDLSPYDLSSSNFEIPSIFPDMQLSKRSGTSKFVEEGELKLYKSSIQYLYLLC